MGSVHTQPLVLVADGIGRTANVPMFVVLRVTESPKQIIGCTGETAIVNCGITVTHVIAEPEQTAVEPVTVQQVEVGGLTVMVGPIQIVM